MTVPGRKVVQVVSLLVAFAWLGWNALPRGESRDAKPVPARAESVAQASSALAAEPETWKRGSLTFHECLIGGVARGGHGPSVKAWCNRFEVPEDHAHPDGRKIRLHLAIVRATSQKVAPDMVVFLAGGPGQAATQAAHVTAALPELARHHDVLLLDQRGTGQSNPLACPDKGDSLDGAPDLRHTRDEVRACLDQVRDKADPRFYTTTAAVQDLEMVRQALGAPAFDLIGVSYGTRVAQHYLKRHPQGVRSMILDSPVPDQVTLGQNMARNLQAALEKDFSLCTRDKACNKRFGDPMHTLTLLAQALEANPHKVSTRDPATFEPEQQLLDRQTLTRVVRFFAYSRAGIALLPLSIDAAAHGDVGPLLGQHQWLHDSSLSQQIAQGMNWSVICSEDADLLQAREEDKGTLLGNSVIDMYRDVCAVWPRGKRPDDFHAPLQSDKPVLILSGELDPVTPPAYGRRIMQGLSNARQLTVKGQGHGVQGVDCMPHLMYRFVETLQPQQLDASCLDRQGPVSPFTSFNGAGP